ncbi:Vta1 like-domain-containing protein [Pilobolus umbonatus]|nr:Vta1 like-domain-containing protein [Pilobolus umbonatus]
MEIPTELKYITPFIQRGQELVTRDPVVSYYAQYYAAKLAISRGPRNKETNDYLSQLLDNLENLKNSIQDNEPITDDLVGYAHVEDFALKVFINADNEDRSGKASKKTAKTFLAASTFLETLKTFGEVDSEVEGKIKYAKWKATDIMKALREGRVPTPGPPGEENDDTIDTVHDDVPPPLSDFPSPPNTSSFTTPPVDPVTPIQPPLPSITLNTPAKPVQPYQQPIPASISPHIDIEAAQKNAKWAISALNYDDIATARTQLLMALNNLGFNQENNYGN